MVEFVTGTMFDYFVSRRGLNQLPKVTVNNLSGDLGLWTADSFVTVTALTHDQFLIEQPGAEIPPGHIDANKILKVEQSVSSGVRKAKSPLLAGRALSDIKNVTLRSYMPPSQRSFWELGSNAATFSYFDGAVGVVTDGYQSNSLNFKPSSDNVRMEPGNWNTPLVHNAWSSTNARLHHFSNLHPTPTTAKVGSPVNLDWIEWGMIGYPDAPTESLLMYIFDVVEIIEDKPTLYFTFDDGNDSHTQVSDHLNNGTKFGGGSFSTTMSPMFSIIDSAVDTANFVTSQNLRDMVSDGSTLCGHGAGNDWGAGTTAAMEAEIAGFQSRVTAESWPVSFGEALSFPGNNNYDLTTDLDEVAQVARDAGCKLNRGNFFFGAGLNIGQIPKSAASSLNSGVGIFTLGQIATSADYVEDSTGAADVINFMDISGLSFAAMGHRVVAAAPTGIDISEAQFDDIIAAFADEISAVEPKIRTANFIKDARRYGIFS